jgi:hypothetical protein
MADERAQENPSTDLTSLVEEFLPGGQSPEGNVADAADYHDPDEYSDFGGFGEEVVEAVEPVVDFANAVGDFINIAHDQGFSDQEIAHALREQTQATDEELEMAIDALSISPEEWQAQYDEINERSEIRQRQADEFADDNALSVVEKMTREAGADPVHAPVIADEADAILAQEYERLVSEGMSPREADEYLDQSGMAFKIVKELAAEAKSAMLSHRLLGGMPSQETLESLRRHNIK